MVPSGAQAGKSLGHVLLSTGTEVKWEMHTPLEAGVKGN